VQSDRGQAAYGADQQAGKLDARRLAILLRTGTLLEVWIPPGELRDHRELLRLCIFLGTVAHTREEPDPRHVSRHNVRVPGADLFGAVARLQLGARLPELPVNSPEAVEQEVATLGFSRNSIESAQQRLEAIMNASVEGAPLRVRSSLPFGVAENNGPSKVHSARCTLTGTEELARSTGSRTVAPTIRIPWRWMRAEEEPEIKGSRNSAERTPFSGSEE
jgi:hypothetical protein